jgi:hypothetical protein
MNDPESEQAFAAKLQQDCAQIDWRMLKPHYDRGAIIIVKEGFDIIEAGVQIARDNADVVNRWIAEQILIKPTPEQADEWEQHNLRFQCVVIAPFVLIQTLSH